MITRQNVVHALPLCAALYLGSGCASHQMLAIKDRDIRDLRQQNASRQEALVKALKTIEAVRAELGSEKYERRELEQKGARSSAAIRLQQQTIDRLETQKAKLQEQLRQSEIAYERLKHTYQDIKAVLSNTVSDLAQTRLEGRPEQRAAGVEDAGTTSEHVRLRRKVDQLRSQVIRERAKRRLATTDRTPPPTSAAPDEEGSPWIWRLTEEPPEVETIEPGQLAIDEGLESKTADSTADESHVLGTAFLWTLGAIPAIGLTLLMFIILIRVLNRPGRDTRDDHEESVRIAECATGSDPASLENGARDHDDVTSDAPRENPDERAVGLDRESPVEVEKSEAVESETRPTDAPPDSPGSSATRENEPPQENESPADTTFIDSLAWLDDTAPSPARRPKHTQDTEAIQLPASADLVEPHPRPTRPVTPDPEPTRRHRATRETDDGNSDTQMIEKIEEDELGATQVLAVLGDRADDDDPDAIDADGSRNQEFTETAVLDASGLGRSPPPEESQGLDDVATDTQVLPPLVDFEEDAELDEALAATIEPDEDEPVDQDGDSDSQLLAELEDLMGEKFEEPAL